MNSNDFRGITGVVNGTTVTLYATRVKGSDTTNTPGELITITDSSGFIGTLAGTIGVIANGGTNKAFKGVALVRVAATWPGVAGDYNGDLEVNDDDDVLWRAAVASQTPLANDPFGLPIDDDQYHQWRAHFGQTSSGAAADRAVAAAAVPKPIIGQLIAVVVHGAVGCVRRRPQRRPAAC